MEDRIKDIRAKIWGLVTVAVIFLAIAGDHIGGYARFFRALLDWIEQWWIVPVLVGIPLVVYFVMFCLFLIVLWIVIRVVRHAWRS